MEESPRAKWKGHKEYVHMGVKNFRHEQCPYTALDSGCKNRHIKEVHDVIKDHICERCGSDFSRKHSLSMHNRACLEKEKKSNLVSCCYDIRDGFE